MRTEQGNFDIYMGKQTWKRNWTEMCFFQIEDEKKKRIADTKTHPIYQQLIIEMR